MDYLDFFRRDFLYNVFFNFGVIKILFGMYIYYNIIIIIGNNVYCKTFNHTVHNNFLVRMEWIIRLIILKYNMCSVVNYIFYRCFNSFMYWFAKNKNNSQQQTQGVKKRRLYIFVLAGCKQNFLHKLKYTKRNFIYN